MVACLCGQGSVFLQVSTVVTDIVPFASALSPQQCSVLFCCVPGGHSLSALLSSPWFLLSPLPRPGCTRMKLDTMLFIGEHSFLKR